MLTRAPARVPSQAAIADAPVPGSKGRVALLQGCAEPVPRPEYRQAAVRLLNRAGYDVLLAPGGVFFGALVPPMCLDGEGRAHARRNVGNSPPLIHKGGPDEAVGTPPDSSDMSTTSHV